MGLERPAERSKVKSVRGTLFRPWENPCPCECTRYGCRRKGIFFCVIPGRKCKQIPPAPQKELAPTSGWVLFMDYLPIFHFFAKVLQFRYGTIPSQPGQVEASDAVEIPRISRRRQACDTPRPGKENRKTRREVQQGHSLRGFFTVADPHDPRLLGSWGSFYNRSVHSGQRKPT